MIVFFFRPRYQTPCRPRPPQGRSTGWCGTRGGSTGGRWGTPASPWGATSSVSRPTALGPSPVRDPRPPPSPKLRPPFALDVGRRSTHKPRCSPLRIPWAPLFLAPSPRYTPKMTEESELKEDTKKSKLGEKNLQRGANLHGWIFSFGFSSCFRPHYPPPPYHHGHPRPSGVVTEVNFPCDEDGANCRHHTAAH